ncbi:DUF4189 domain-containing protein [Variovorax gossypii]|uniref:DUF4189 domain-containing protein n=2 Tax=Variovorax TaxID=34072 RepID=A0A431TJH4_9BURK|nr:DUF4189 domain-containing protein [Variovorax gossypii]RTQ33051.1 DUF4189 domain-containing protein [Variovorax gossypii]
MKRALLIFFLASQSVLFFGPQARAQVACPSGWIPYSATSCGPAPNSQQSPKPNDHGAPLQLGSRWGAIATDGVKGVLGTATGERSEQGAAGKALADCQAKGGAPCKLQISYANGCAAMIVGGRGFSTAYAGTKEEAIQRAMAVCRSDGDTECHVYYTDCSLPRRDSWP